MNRRQAREEAFKLLFQLEINDQQEISEKWDNSYIKTVVPGVMDHKLAIDKQITNQLINWSFERIAPVEKTILRIAIYELNEMEDIPSAVSINEAVELAHIYGDEKSSKFINGVLSKIIN